MVLDSDKIRRKIEEVKDLPTLPTVASEIIALARSPKTNAADVGKMIEKDPSLMTKVLKLVNSSFYGFPGKIKTIQHAVVIIGFNKVKNVVISASVFDMSKGRDSNQLDIGRFWQHSLGTAIAARVISPALNKGLEPEDSFVGGLVHGIGKLILDQFLQEEYGKVMAIVREKDCLLTEAEKEHLGFTYSTVGSWLAERWKLPATLQACIRFHENPMKAREERDMVAAVHIGNILARALFIGNAGDNRIPPLNPQLWAQYNLTTEFLDESLKLIIEELRKAQEFFNLIEQ